MKLRAREEAQAAGEREHQFLREDWLINETAINDTTQEENYISTGAEYENGRRVVGPKVR